MHKIEHNIAKIYLIKTARWLMLTTPYLPLFMGENGIDKSSYSLLAAIHALSIIFLEIPSGYLADAIGRKKTLIVGAVLGALGYVIYSMSYSFNGFLLAVVALGIGQSMISGADSAMLYESLVATNKVKDYSRYEGRIIALGSFLETAGAPLGGLLAVVSLRYPFIAQAAIALIAVPAALTLVEPEGDVKAKERSKKMLPALKQALFFDRKLLLLLCYSALFGAGTYTMAKAIPYWHNETVQSSALELGFFWSALNLSAALFSSFAYRLERKMDQLTFMACTGFVVSLSFFGLGYANQYVAMALLFLFYCCRGLAAPILKNYINDITQSEIRATVLSIRPFFVYILFALLFPVMGWVGDLSTWGTALMLSSGFFTLVGSVVFFCFYLLQKKVATSDSLPLDLPVE